MLLVRCTFAQAAARALWLLVLGGSTAACAGLEARVTPGPRPLSAAQPVPTCAPKDWTVPERQMARTFVARHAGHAVFSVCTDKASWRLREETSARQLDVDVWVRTQQADRCFAFRSTFHLESAGAAPAWTTDAPGTLEMDCATNRPVVAPAATKALASQVATKTLVSQASPKSAPPRSGAAVGPSTKEPAARRSTTRKATARARRS